MIRDSLMGIVMDYNITLGGNRRLRPRRRYLAWANTTKFIGILLLCSGVGSFFAWSLDVLHGDFDLSLYSGYGAFLSPWPVTAYTLGVIGILVIAVARIRR